MKREKIKKKIKFKFFFDSKGPSGDRLWRSLSLSKFVHNKYVCLCVCVRESREREKEGEEERERERECV